MSIVFLYISHISFYIENLKLNICIFCLTFLRNFDIIRIIHTTKGRFLFATTNRAIIYGRLQTCSGA